MADKWALEVDATIVQIEYQDPAGRFSPELTFHQVPIEHSVQVGWIVSSGSLLPPPDAPTSVKTVPASTFWGLISLPYQLAIVEAAESDNVVRTLLNNFRLNGAHVVPGDLKVKALVEYLAGGTVDGGTITTTIMTAPQAQDWLDGQEVS